jgi:acyl carrier protein
MGLDVVELVIRIENAFGIDIPNEVAAQLTTPRNVIDYVLLQLTSTAPDTNQRRMPKPWTREEVAALVREVIVDETGVEEFTEDSRFVADMNLD